MQMLTKYRCLALILPFAVVATTDAAVFDGSKPLECAVESGHDCLPGASLCRPLEPQTSIAPVFHIDLPAKAVHSPYRTERLPISHITTNKKSLVLQGADLLFAWSAVINKSTGALAVSIADRSGAYVAFGHCKRADPERRTHEPSK